MREIERLRVRLKNIQKNVVEYRMTVTEARALLQEIDNLQAKSAVVEKPATIVVEEKPQPRILDGGSF